MGRSNKVIFPKKCAHTKWTPPNYDASERKEIAMANNSGGYRGRMEW